MSNLQNVLDTLNDIYYMKNDIKQSLENRGVNMTNIPFNEYSNQIDNVKVELPYFSFAYFSGTNIEPLLNKLIFNNVINMSNMFSFCTNLINIPNFNTSKVTNMGHMFYQCYNLNTIPNFDTSNVTSMIYMFSDCYNLTTIPNLNTSNVSDMKFMFSGCNNLTIIPNFDTSNVTSMIYMFTKCTNLTTIPELNTSNVTNMIYMFSGCNNLSDASIQNIINMCLNSNITDTQRMNLNNANFRSPLASTNINSSRYTNRLNDLTNAGWSY